MSKFSHRSSALELMDLPIENRDEIYQNFAEIVKVNKYLGGAEHSWNIIKKTTKTGPLKIADIGSGACDFFAYVNKKKSNVSFSFLAVDNMKEAHEYARRAFPEIGSRTTYIEEDYQTWLNNIGSVDIIHAGLFCHHLTDDQFVEFIRLTRHKANLIVLNDLHRHPLAYYSIKWITMLFARSRYTKNDAPLSVLRGFKRKELENLLGKAGVENYEIKWKWAFRYLITIH